MLFQIKSNKSMDEIERGLQESAARHQFGVIAVHDLQETLKKREWTWPWNAGFTKSAIPTRPRRCSTPMARSLPPCRAAFPCTAPAKEYTLATMRPTEMMKAFANPEIEPVAQEVETVILQMMQDAAGG